MKPAFNPLTSGLVRPARSVEKRNLPIFVATDKGTDRHTELTNYFDDLLYVPIHFTDCAGYQQRGWASAPALRLLGQGRTIRPLFTTRTQRG
jgi:hypothetical protein